MAQLTWRDVSVPNTSGAAATFANANQTIQQSISNLGTLATNYGNQQQSANTDAALAQISQASSTGELDALTSPEALQQFGNFDRGQVAQAVNNLRQRFTQNETQADQFAQRQDLAERQFVETQAQNDANNQFRLDQLALQRERNNVYNRSVGLQANRAELERKGVAAYDAGYKEGGNFSSESELNTFLAKKRQEQLDAGQTAAEVENYSRGVRERFQGMITNSPTGSTADSVTQSQTTELTNLIGRTTDALNTNRSVANPDNNIVAQLPDLNTKIVSNQDAISILTERFGKGSGSAVRKYITEGRKGNNPLPLGVLVASALQNAGDSSVLFGTFGNEFFDTSGAITQAKRITTGLQDGSISQAGQITETGLNEVNRLSQSATSALTNLNNAIRFAGTVSARSGEESPQAQEALQAVEKARARYEDAKATLQKYSDRIINRSNTNPDGSTSQSSSSNPRSGRGLNNSSYIPVGVSQ